jgi:hypothetical protein
LAFGWPTEVSVFPMVKVNEAWSNETPNHYNHLDTLHIKMSKTTKALNAWSKTLIPQGEVTMVICREVVDQLERARELR